VVIVLGNYVEEECLSELGVNRSCCGGLVQGEWSENSGEPERSVSHSQCGQCCDSGIGLNP